MNALLNKWFLSFLTLCVVLIGVVFIQNSVMSNEVASGHNGNSKTAAVVNGESIMKDQLFIEMYKMQGQQILDGLINQKLIEQEAKKLNLNPTEEEISKELDKIKSNLGDNYSNALADSQITEDELKKNIAFSVVQQKMFSEKVTVSEQEINDYLTQFPEEERADQKENVKEFIQSQKIQQEVQTWLEEARAKANIQINM